ncbi:MAG: response regulator, partial [Alteromonas sp.]
MNKTHILIVEDDAGLREALSDTLELGGYSVIAAEDAEMALVMLNQHQVDLVVSDIQM